MSRKVKNFSESAKFYDSFYKKKDYKKEVNYISHFLPKKKIDILELGCGTGSHLIFLSSKKNSILAIDKSKDMILKAKQKVKLKKIKSIKFKVKDIIDFKSKEKFDVCLMMFNVINYIDTDTKLKKLFSNIHSSLKKDGLLIFDQWKFAKINKKNIKIKKIITNKQVIQRKGKTELIKSNNHLKIDYEYNTRSLINGEIKNFVETHYLKIYNLNKIKLLFKNKFKILKYLSWMYYKKKPSNRDTQSFVVAKKINL